jgi:hypothetical protein
MKVTAAFIGLSCISTLACADVSDDLKFCGARKSTPERLACFEAVARGVSRPAPARPVARAVPLDAQAAMPVKATAPDPLPARNPFDGYYAAIGGGYGVGSGRDASFSVRFFGSGGFTSANGPNATFVAGRNIAIGWGIIGLEVAGRWEGEHGDSLRQSGLSAFAYKNDVGINAAIRAGASFEDLLVYAKAGLGATRVNENFTVDERVVSFSPGPLYSVRVTSWLPTAVFGVGVEKNWGPVFTRLSADFEAFNHNTTALSGTPIFGSSSASQIMWATRGTALIGVRF